MPVIDIEIRAAELKKSLDNISKRTEQALNDAIKNIAYLAYSEAQRLAQEKLITSRQDYLSGLKFEQLDDNVYLIWLEGDPANAIEEGWSSFDMKPGLLSGPNAKVTAKGTRFNTVPFQQRPFSKAKSSAGVRTMRDAVNRLIKEQGFDKIIQEKGRPKIGVAATIKNTGIRDLEGLVKIQKEYEGRVQSTYLTFRRVSDNSAPDKWIHPGYVGAKIFKDVEQYVDREVDRILKVLL